MSTFNPRAAKLLQPGDYLLVEGCPGLRLVAAESRKRWVYRYKDDAGRMKQVKLGEWPAMSVGDAVSAWNTKREGKSAGEDPAAERKAKKVEAIKAAAQEFATVSALVQDFIDGYIKVQRKSASADAAESALTRLLAEEPSFASMAPRRVDRSVAYRIIDSRRNFPMAAKKLRSLLGQAWDRGLDSGRLAPDVPNWWRLILRGQLRSQGKIIGGEHVGRVKRVLSTDELRVLLPWARANFSQSSLDGLLLYLLTGMRGVEIFSLRVEYIRQESTGWWITFPAHLLKMERDADIVDHRVPLFGEALEIVQRRMASAWEGWLFFTGRGGNFRPYHRNTFSSYVYSLMPNSAKAKRRAGEGLICPVQNWSPHDLRRTARTLLAKLRCPDEVGEAIIGHKPAVMPATYNLHTYDDEKVEWLTRLGALISSLEADRVDSSPGVVVLRSA